MKQFFAIIFTVLFSFVQGTKAQVVDITNPGNTTPTPMAATYPSLASAITALNAATGITGPIILTLRPGNPQTTPAGGYVINFTAATTATNTVTLEGNNNTITAFTPQTSGLVTDAIFKLVGVDYVTIQHFTMQENASNTGSTAASNNMTEWGVALLHASPTNGAQNNTIQNNVISLNKTYTNTFGIYSNSRHNTTTVGGTDDASNGTTGPNSNNKIYGNTISNVNMGITFVGVSTAANMDSGNDIGGSSAATGNTITNWGSTGPAATGYISSSGTYHGIFMNHQVGDNVSYNTLVSATFTGTNSNVHGIYKRYATGNASGTFTSTISNNSITLTSNITGSSDVYAIRNTELSASLPSATININNNTILNCSIGAASSGNTIYGILTSSLFGIVNINGNIFRGNTSTATSGNFTAINNNAATATTLNINGNSIGDAIGNAITFSAANSGLVTAINTATVASGATISISNNNFKGFVNTVAGSGSHTYINFSHASSGATTDNINNNTFTNITANTSGSVTFISRNTGNMAVSAGATENCNNNSIVTAFSKPVAGGTVYLYTASGGSLGGNNMNQTGNNFSNITLTGATLMSGWANTEGGLTGPVKTITNNTFSNWTCGTSAVNVISTNFSENGTTVSNNTISNISCTGGSVLNGILLGSSNKGNLQTCANNTISGLSTQTGLLLGISVSTPSVTTLNVNNNTISGLSCGVTGSFAALRVISAGTLNIFKNKIYDINGTASGTLTYGIDIQPGFTGAGTIHNNLVGNLHAPIANNINAVRGISVSSTASTATHFIYYNTIYINTSSTATDFGSSGIFLTGSSTATNGPTVLRNNIIVNTSVAKGTGLTVAYRRSINQLNNYVNSSNNNIFYAGTPSATNVIFSDGSVTDQTLAAFKIRVAPTRETASFTEMPAFLSTAGASANFLHLDPVVPTQAESGAVNIAAYTTDYDNDIRQGNGGYTGTGTAPDIGADEIEGIYSEINPPVITYTALTTPTCTYSGMTLTGVNITDATGVPLSGATIPRIYYRKNAGTWFSQPGTNTSGTTLNSNWSFTIVETDMGTLTGGDIISYYVIAQDLNPIPNLGSNPSGGLVATSVTAVTTHPTTPNTYTLSYNMGGIYTVGVGGNFTTLTAAVNAYNNACSLVSATVFELIDNTYPSETYPITINNHVDASAIKTLTIRPSATAVPVITGTVNTQTFALDGAKYIRFDGRQGGVGTTKTLTISNSSTGMAFLFQNEAQNNVVRYCIVRAQRVSTASGTIVFAATTAPAGTGNDNNTIDNNDITDAGLGSFSNIGIYSNGTAGKENDNIIISNNNISNYFNAINSSYGIFVSQNSNTWTITGNRLFQTATRVYTAATTHGGININTAGTGYTISNNIIGFSNAAGTGTTNMMGNNVAVAGFPGSYALPGAPIAIRYFGIGISAANASGSNIDGNTIAGFAMFTASAVSTNFGIFAGIYVEQGSVNVGVNAGNIIGSTTGNNSIYVATNGGGGTFVGIRAGASGTAAIQNNSIGGILLSGGTASTAINFLGINIAVSANYTVSNNSIGNADANNIQMGYVLSGGQLSNTGTLTAANASTTTTFRGIISTATGGLNITNNTLRGWNTSYGMTYYTGIETSGITIGTTTNVNNNFIGTAATDWLNSTVNNTAFFYTINVTNTFGTVYNIKDNDFRGIFFGTMTNIGGSFLRLTGGGIAVSTISGNTFTNLAFRFSAATLYPIFTNYSLSATAQLIIDNNRTVGTFTSTNATGVTAFHLIHCDMGASNGSRADITNNSFSGINGAVSAFSTNLYGIYASFGGGSSALTITGNTLNNWTSGYGATVGIDFSNITGTVNCQNNTVSNITCTNAIDGIAFSPDGASGTINVTNNTITNLTLGGIGGYITGISTFVPDVSNTTQLKVANNNLHTYTASNPTSCVISGIYLFSGHATSTVTINANKIYDLTGTAADCQVAGINNYVGLIGNLTYTNNYIGDLKAPNSNIATPAVSGIKILTTVGGQSKVFYNTIHLNATGSGSQFSTAGIYADASSALTLRNNIISNVSGHGASGRTISYWRTGSLGPYDATSNNNVFYAGTASAQNLIYYDGTNSDQTLAAYKTRVSPRDNVSISLLPAFISTTGSDATFLHLNDATNCGINAKGNNAGILLVNDYDADARSISSPFVTDIGADEFSKKNIWTGANGTSWNDIGNWSQGIIPNTDNENVVISSPPANQPVIAPGNTYQVSSVIMGTGATLTNRGTLKIAGVVYASPASINNIQSGVVEGSVELNGNCATLQTFAGNVFVNNAVYNFTASNDVTVSTVSGEHVSIHGELGFGAVSGRTFTTNDNIILASTANSTGSVGKITGGNIIAGTASVERYIHIGVGGGRHAKGWQFLATPAKGQSVYQSWQENGTTPAGYGTIITGTGTGFDMASTLPSMKYYDPTLGAAGNWVGINSTANQVNDQRGYMIFVRGDRTVTAYNAAANNTNLRIKGTLYQPNDPPPVTNVLAGKLASVGNPYASAINLVYMKNNGLFVNLDNDVVVWDPLLYGAYGYGGYQTLSAANNYEPTAGGTVFYPAGVPSPNIQSGQAFFVKSSGSAGSVTFTEAAKASGSKLVNRFVLPTASRYFFRASLYTNTGLVADGNAVAFDIPYNNKIDQDDSHKLLNSGENFYIQRDGKALAVEARQPVTLGDTIFYQLSNLRKQPYQLRFAPTNMQTVRLNAYLIDKYLHSTTILSLKDSSFININITDDPLSYAADRFYVVFKRIPFFTQPYVSEQNRKPAPKKDSLTIAKPSITVYPNPVVDKTIQLHFVNQPIGTAKIQLINKLGQQVYNSDVEIDQINNTRPIKLNGNLVSGNYQLVIITADGRKTMLQIMIP